MLFILYYRLSIFPPIGENPPKTMLFFFKMLKVWHRWHSLITPGLSWTRILDLPIDVFFNGKYVNILTKISNGFIVEKWVSMVTHVTWNGPYTEYGDSFLVSIKDCSTHSDQFKSQISSCLWYQHLAIYILFLFTNHVIKTIYNTAFFSFFT